MRAKEYLRRLSVIEQNIKQLEQEIGRLESWLTSCTAQYGIKAGATPEERDESIARLVDAKGDYLDSVCRAMRERHRIISEIQSIGDATASAVLYKRYAEFKSIEVVAAELHYSYDWTRKLHGRALQLFEKHHPQKAHLK